MRTEIAVTQLDSNTPVEYLTTAGDAANGMHVAKSRLVFIRVENGGESDCTVTVLEGDPQASAFLARDNDTLSVTVPAGQTRLLTDLTSARFYQGHWYFIDLDQDDSVQIGAVCRPGGL